MTIQIGVDTRRALVVLRRFGHRDGSARTLQYFPASAGLPAHDQVALASLKAELQHLDGRHEAALRVFDEEIDPNISGLDLDSRINCLENKSFLLLNAFRAGAVHLRYQLSDRRVLFGSSARGYDRVVVATDAANSGSHQEALTGFWAELRASYAGMLWRRRVCAHADLGREFLSLGLAVPASYHIAFAAREDLTAQLGEVLVRGNNSAVIAEVISRAWSFSGLCRPAIHTLRLVATVADLLPDDHLPATVEAVAARAMAPAEVSLEVAAAREAWKAVQALGDRLTAPQAESLVSGALEHRAFAKDHGLREAMLQSVETLLSVCTPEFAAKVAPRLARAAAEDRSDRDYAEALRAVMHAVERSGKDEVRDAVAAILYPAGRRVQDEYLLKAAPFFRIAVGERNEINAQGLAAAKALARQVEHLGPSESPSKVPGFGVWQTTDGERTLVVHVHGAIGWVEGVVAHKALLDGPTVRAVADAAIERAADNDNLVVNRIGLVQLIERLFADMDEQAIERSVEVLRGLAAGDFQESSVAMRHAEAQSPLAAVKMSGGDPDVLQGSALLALARPSVKEERAARVLGEDGSLGKGLSSPRPGLRAYGAAAAKEVPSLSPSEASALFLCAADPDRRTASFAISALEEPSRLGLDRQGRELLVGVLERALDRSETSVRASAAAVVRRLGSGHELEEALSGRLNRMRSRLMADASAWVRRSVNGTNAGEAAA